MAEKELTAARAIAEKSGVREHRFFRLPDLREASDLPVKFKGLPPVYIPMRNAIFYSIAASYAEEVGAGYLVGGHNKDDMRVFNDVGAPFFEDLQSAFRKASDALNARRLQILRPLQGKTKDQVVTMAAELGVPFESTWSCHSSGRVHCWKCQGCLAREKAFMRAGVADPLRREGRRQKVS